MFGKIKDKLKNLFSKTEDVVDENPDEFVEEEQPQLEEKPKKEKKKTPTKKKKEEPKEEPLKGESKKPKKSPAKKKKPKKEEKEDEPEPVQETEEPPEEISEEPEEKVEEEPKEEKKKGLFGGLFKKKEKTVDEEPEQLEDQSKEEKSKEIVEQSEEKKEGLISKTFKKVASKKITEEDFDKIWLELEIFLLEINIAFEIVQNIEVKLRESLIGNAFSRFGLSNKIREVMVSEVESVLKDREAHFLDKVKEVRKSGEPVKILVLGVNGTGKTTTIAKVVKYIRDNKLSVVVAAADTFRAAAIEQLDEHAKKLDFKLIQHKGGSDPAAVAYDAIEHAKAKNIDVVLIDTAGRMPNNSNLMMELQKIKKVSEAQMAMFVGDSISGNDLIDQITLFDQGVDIDGVILTKVDTDEKPGSVVTTAYSIEKPIYFLGIGQTYDDLIEFNAKHIAEQLFSTEE